jgi:hypothetical protein
MDNDPRKVAERRADRIRRAVKSIAPDAFDYRILSYDEAQDEADAFRGALSQGPTP